MSAMVDPDCAAGKHRNCSGSSWDNEADAAAPCPCSCHLTHRMLRADLEAAVAELGRRKNIEAIVSARGFVLLQPSTVPVLLALSPL